MSDLQDADRELLKRSDLLKGLSDEEVDLVLAIGELQTYAEGETIVEEDQKGTTSLFLLQGRVDIEIRPPFSGRKPQKLATIKRGEMFGELSLVDGYLRSASAKSLDEVQVLSFENERLEALMKESPRIGYHVMRNVANVLASRIRATNMKLRNALSDIFYY